MRKKYEKIDRRSVFSKINSKGAIGACAPEIPPKMAKNDGVMTLKDLLYLLFPW